MNSSVMFLAGSVATATLGGALWMLLTVQVTETTVRHGSPTQLNSPPANEPLLQGLERRAEKRQALRQKSIQASESVYPDNALDVLNSVKSRLKVIETEAKSDGRISANMISRGINTIRSARGSLPDAVVEDLEASFRQNMVDLKNEHGFDPPDNLE